MLREIRMTFRNGALEPAEELGLEEGEEVLVTLIRKANHFGKEATGGKPASDQGVGLDGLEKLKQVIQERRLQESGP